jgi:hypothetical protein
MLPFTPINSRDTKTTIRGFENSQFSISGLVSQERHSTTQPTDFPVFDPKLFSMGSGSSSQQDNQKEHKNIDRGFMSQRNYEQETSERLNGFSIIPKDTRHDTTKKQAEQLISPITNRTTGIPFNKI